MIEILTYFGIITLVYWVSLYVGFLTGVKKEVQIDKYFQAMFVGFRASKLRLVWKVIILAIEYIIGFYALLVVKTSWKMSMYTKQVTKWIFVTEEDEVAKQTEQKGKNYGKQSIRKN